MSKKLKYRNLVDRPPLPKGSAEGLPDLEWSLDPKTVVELIPRLPRLRRRTRAQGGDAYRDIFFGRWTDPMVVAFLTMLFSAEEDWFYAKVLYWVDYLKMKPKAIAKRLGDRPEAIQKCLKYARQRVRVFWNRVFQEKTDLELYYRGKPTGYDSRAVAERGSPLREEDELEQIAREEAGSFAGRPC